MVCKTLFTIIINPFSELRVKLVNLDVLEFQGYKVMKVNQVYTIRVWMKLRLVLLGLKDLLVSKKNIFPTQYAH